MAQHDVRVASRYARALYGAAEANQMVDAVEDDLRAILGIMGRDKAFRDFLIAPYTGREEKLEILERIFSDRITALTMQVLRVMLEKRREGEIEGIYDAFVALRRDKRGVIFATIISAEQLDDKQQKALAAKLEKTTGKVVEADFHVDPHLIGGVKVAYENYVLDGTLKGGLAHLSDHLKHDILKQF